MVQYLAGCLTTRQAETLHFNHMSPHDGDKGHPTFQKAADNYKFRGMVRVEKRKISDR